MDLKKYISERGIIAGIAIFILGFLIYSGFNGTILIMLNTIVVWYFSKSGDPPPVNVVGLTEIEMDKLLDRIDRRIDKRLRDEIN